LLGKAELLQRLEQVQAGSCLRQRMIDRIETAF